MESGLARIPLDKDSKIDFQANAYRMENAGDDMYDNDDWKSGRSISEVAQWLKTLFGVFVSLRFTTFRLHLHQARTLHRDN